MGKGIKIYDLHDQQQYEDEKAHWKKKTPEERLHALEIIRKSMAKLSTKKDRKNGNQQRLRRVFRIVKRT